MLASPRQRKCLATWNRSGTLPCDAMPINQTNARDVEWIAKQKKEKRMFVDAFPLLNVFIFGSAAAFGAWERASVSIAHNKTKPIRNYR